MSSVVYDVVSNGIVGDFAELGVWRGGLCIFAKGLFKALEQDRKRKIHVFDAFDIIKAGPYKKFSDFLKVSHEQVEINFRKYDLMDQNVLIHKGYYQNSLPNFYKAFEVRSDQQVSLAILRIDCNFYASYQDAFYYLYGFVPVGGYVIMDDYYSHPGARNVRR